MSRKLLGRLAAGLLGTLVLSPFSLAQQQSGGPTGGTQTGSTQTGTTQGGGTTSSQTGTSTGSPVGSSSGGGQSFGSPIGAASGPMQFGPSAGGGTSGSAARGGTRGTIGGRTGTSAAGRGGVGTSASLMRGAGGGGLSNMQTNRQNARRAQYITRLDFGPAPEPAELQVSTLELRGTIEQSLAAVVPTGVSAVIDGSSVILRGTVSTAADSKLAERMVLLEPGVRSVKNELVVQGNSGSGR